MQNKAIKELKARFGDGVEVAEKNRKRFFVTVWDVKLALDVVRFLFKEMGLRYSITTGLDRREGIELIYHMADDRNGARISVRTLAEKPDPVVPSATSFMDGAEWIEREIHELLGVNFTGHPNLKRLLLPDDWPEGVYPLRKGQ